VTTVVEWLLRNTMPFVIIAVLTRWVLPPRLGKNGVVEVLFLNTIGDLVAHSAFEEQHSLVTGLGSIALWVLFAGAAAYLYRRGPGAGRFVGYFSESVLLVRNGKPEESGLKRTRIAVAELESELRKQGIDQVGQVKSATVEPDGSIAVVEKDGTTVRLERIEALLTALQAEVGELRRKTGE
jgi:uncharacterized membrane protein YcaP (DUF421 family)